MKKLLGDCINLLSLCFIFSSLDDGNNRSLGIYEIKQTIEESKLLFACQGVINNNSRVATNLWLIVGEIESTKK